MDFYAVAYGFTKLKMYPFFDSVHFILSCITVREDAVHSLGTQSAAQQFSQKHPLALWVSSMLTCFAGSLLISLLFGKPVVAVLQNTDQILLSTTIWYLVNYSPADVVYRILKWSPMKMLLIALKEVHRTYGIHHAVHMASKLYPDSPIIYAVAGMIKGSSYVWMRPVERFVRGLWLPSSNELLMPTFISKASLLVSILFILEDKEYIALDHSILFTAVIVAMIYFRLSTYLLGARDPFTYVENVACGVFLGGLWESLRGMAGEGTLQKMSAEQKANARQPDKKND